MMLARLSGCSAARSPELCRPALDLLRLLRLPGEVIEVEARKEGAHRPDDVHHAALGSAGGAGGRAQQGAVMAP
jgi:hypothetical protein